MQQIVDNLRDQEYVNSDNVEALRRYIRVKQPNSSGEELSAVFADALHKIIDTRICQFEEKHRKRIKEDVLSKAVKKNKFSIDAAEVFSSCLSLKLHEDSYINSFTQWINQNQPITISAEKVDKLVSNVELFDGDYIENNLEDIVDRFEVSWAEEETLAVLSIESIEPEELQTYEEIISASDDNHIKPVDIVESKWIEKVGEFVEVQVPGAESAVSGITMEQRSASNIHWFGFNELFASISKLAALTLGNMKYIKPSLRVALPVAAPLVIVIALVLTGLPSDSRIHALQYRDRGRYANVSEDQVDRYLSLESKVLYKLDGLTGEKGLVLLDDLQLEFKYQIVDEGKLKKWLDKKNSMLSEDPYFSAILETSKKYDIHPLLMFAIVGQEQAFVPKNGASAKRIANNPFNVYGSWEKYNTNIYDSSRLAADTIIKSSRSRPAYMDTIRWINRRYAEDPNWWNGVSRLFAQMKKEMDN